MKVFTRNEFSTKQRLILSAMASSPIESELERVTALAYWRACMQAIVEQTKELGGAWNIDDMSLLCVVGKRVLETQGLGESVRRGIDASLLQMAELHPALALINPDFIE